jgi:hypothetical protein
MYQNAIVRKKLEPFWLSGWLLMGWKLQRYYVEKSSQGRVGATIECLHIYLRIHTLTGLMSGF